MPLSTARNNAEHARRRRARVAKAQQSNVDDIVFGHDIDKSAEVVPEDRDRELRNGMRLRAVDGAMLGPKRHVGGAHAESHLREIAMRWDPGGRRGSQRPSADACGQHPICLRGSWEGAARSYAAQSAARAAWQLAVAADARLRPPQGGGSGDLPPAGGADVGREISEYERWMRDAPLSPGIRKAGGLGPPSQKGLLDYGGAGGTHVPSAAAPPRSQLLGSNVAGIVFHADEDGVGRPPSRQTSFAQAVGLAPKKNLSPERLSRGKLDFSGRAKATTVVDEVVFNKTGDHMRGTNLQANFTTDHHGEFAKGARFCVPGPELSVR